MTYTKNNTVLIVDAARCGTTMLTGIIHLLGVPMFDENNVRRRTLEDLIIIEALKSEKEIQKVIEDRNKKYDIWGFKYPNLWKHPYTIQYLRDPIYFTIFKEPVSISLRRYRKCDHQRMRQTLGYLLRSVNEYSSLGLNINYLSYLNAVTRPERFVDEIIKIIGISPSPEQIETAIDFIRPRVGYPKQRVKLWNKKL